MLTAKMQLSAAASSSETDESNGRMGSNWEVDSEADLDDVSCLLGDAAPAVSSSGDVDLRVARLELLIDRRALLLSGVLLRQNPHNVAEASLRLLSSWVIFCRFYATRLLFSSAVA